MHHLSDTQLARLYRETRQDQYFSEIHERHKDALSKILRRFAANRPELDLGVIVSDTFIALHKHLLSEQPIRNVQAWLCTALKHKAMEAIRHCGRQKRDIRRTVPLRTDEAIEAKREIEQLNERIDELWDAVGKLSEDLQAVVDLRLQGHSAAAISRALHIPIGTVKTRERIAARKLREKLSRICA
jgi:RNA polymerase sigma factor (sigma-70 family)